MEEASNDKKDPIEEGEIQEAQNEETEEVKTKDQTEYKDETTQVQAVNIEEEGKVSEVEGEVETVKEAEWLEITPGKASRSPNTKQKDLEYSQAILTKSRFEVISPENEGKYDEEVREGLSVDEEVQEEEDVEEVELEEKEEIRFSRQVLPRESKLNHRYLGDKGGQKAQDGDPSFLKKKKSRR